MVALPTTPTHSPPRLKTRVGGSTSPRALRVGKIPRQPRGPHRKITTRARRFAVGSSHWSSLEPLIRHPQWVALSQAFGGQASAYAYANNAPLRYVDIDGLWPLPTSPAGLPPGWAHDPSHRDPNGSRWRGPDGDYLDFHVGRPGKPGWRGKDHWHHNGGEEHLRPGDEIPDKTICQEAPNLPSPDDPWDFHADDFFCALVPEGLMSLLCPEHKPIPIYPLPGPLPFPVPAFP